MNPVYRSVVMELYDAALPDHVSAGEIDKLRLPQTVTAMLMARHPDIYEALAVEAREYLIHLWMDEYCRFTKHPLMLTDREIRDTDRKVISARRVLQIRQPGGTYIAKRAMDMSRDDVAQYIKQLDSTISGFKRHRDFWAGVYFQMSLLGEQATVSDVVTESDIEAADVA